ncbi:DUF6053 domain-containing protein [Lysobacter enzymogenes]|uniref:DUF6053 domain-containing protein n=1 Tax=Lysobacter enzymogenes TaxID=69 RepID=UPI00374915AD
MGGASGPTLFGRIAATRHESAGPDAPPATARPCEQLCPPPPLATRPALRRPPRRRRPIDAGRPTPLAPTLPTPPHARVKPGPRAQSYNTCRPSSVSRCP